MSRFLDRLTYANVMATIAVFLAIGGGTFAIAAIKKNSVKSKQIKDGAVQTIDIANGAVSGAKLGPGAVGPGAIGDGAIGSAQIADNSLTGADIVEASLQGVNAASAVNAANADKVGGLEVKQIDFQVPVPTAIQSVLVYPGIFRIDAQCQNFGDGLDVSAASGVAGSRISLVAMRTADAADDSDGVKDFGAQQDSSLDPGEVFGIDDEFPGLSQAQQVTIHFSTPAGFAATIELSLAEAADRCRMTGAAISG